MADQEKFRGSGKLARGGLFLAIFAAIVSWGVQHTEHGHDIWIELADPRHFFSLLGVVVSVWGAWRSGIRSARRAAR